MSKAELQAHIEDPKNLKSVASGPRTFQNIVMHQYNGDVARVVLGVDDAGVVVDAGFKSVSTGVVIGCLSWLTEWAKGKPLAEVEQVDAIDLVTMFEIPDIRRDAPHFAKRALFEAVQVAKQGMGMSTPDQVLESLVTKLEVIPEAFDAASFAKQLERAQQEIAEQGYTFDGTRVLAGLVAQMNGLSMGDACSYTFELGRCCYLDGGLRERVGKQLLAIFEERGLLAGKS